MPDDVRAPSTFGLPVETMIVDRVALVDAASPAAGFWSMTTPAGTVSLGRGSTCGVEAGVARSSRRPARSSSPSTSGTATGFVRVRAGPGSSCRRTSRRRRRRRAGAAPSSHGQIGRRRGRLLVVVVAGRRRSAGGAGGGASARRAITVGRRRRVTPAPASTVRRRLLGLRARPAGPRATRARSASISSALW